MKPLEGIRVIDLSRLLPGPYCTRLLGDMGAEVIKVEEPGRGDYLRALPPFENGVSVAFEVLNRGKKSITLNLETEQGREILSRLVSKADVFLESFQPGTTKKLGCDFDSVRRVNPRIVYCSLTAYGQTGPYRDMPGHDINFIALSGFLSLNGKPEPTVPGLQVGDLAGGMLAALTITSALFARQRTKQAQYIDVGILDALLSWLTIPLALRLSGEYRRMLEGDSPFYRIYRTLDSKLLAVGAIEPKFWEQLCEVIDRPELTGDQFSSQPRLTEVTRIIEAALAQKTRDEWFRIMLEHGLPCTSVLSLEEVIKNTHARAREMILEGETSESKVVYVGNPCKISNIGQVDLSHSPYLGEHSIQILREIGYPDPVINDFAKVGVIGGN